jgi:hypothetical protein
VQELGRRLTAEEFEEWRVMFAVEQLHPALDAQRHAQLLAAAHNGPLTRKDKKMWRPAEFVDFDPWAKPKAHAKRSAQPTPAQLEAQVKALNGARRKH